MAGNTLTPTEVSTLFVLMAEVREVPNAELTGRFGLKLEPASRNKLNDLKLVESRRERNRWYHVLADEGWARCAEEMTVPRRGAGHAALYATMAGLSRYLDRIDRRLSDVYLPYDDEPTPEPPAPPAADLGERIRAAYRSLVASPGGWVSLTRLRPALGDVPRAEVDDALRRLYREPDVNLVPESNQKVLTPEDRAAAVHVGDQDKHLIGIQSS